MYIPPSEGCPHRQCEQFRVTHRCTSLLLSIKSHSRTGSQCWPMSWNCYMCWSSTSLVYGMKLEIMPHIFLSCIFEYVFLIQRFFWKVSEAGMNMKTILRVLSCSDMRDKDFLLKIYLENHKPRVDGNSSGCASTHQHTYHYYDAICQNSNQGNRERKHAGSEKIKNSYIDYSRICIKTDVFEDESRRHYKCIVSWKERL